MEQLHGGEKTQHILVYFHLPPQPNKHTYKVYLSWKKIQMKRTEAAGGERAEQLQQADPKCCQILHNLLNWEATFTWSLKNIDFMLWGP